MGVWVGRSFGKVSGTHLLSNLCEFSTVSHGASLKKPIRWSYSRTVYVTVPRDFRVRSPCQGGKEPGQAYNNCKPRIIRSRRTSTYMSSRGQRTLTDSVPESELPSTSRTGRVAPSVKCVAKVELEQPKTSRTGKHRTASGVGGLEEPEVPTTRDSPSPTER